jgi:glyoxylase-like metal-dependent hydrolase (beta-lactamase superfamily II)
MDADDFPTPDESVDELTAAELEQRIDAGEDVTVLDTRMESDFETWRIEGDSVEITNVPYYEFLDEVDDDLLERVPEGDPLVVLCAKGGASEYVAGRLAEAGRDVVHLAEGMNGWARLYDLVEVDGYDGPGALYQYQRPSSGCLAYLVVSDGEAAVVDPLRAFTPRYLADAEELGASLKYAIDTHVHADHVSGVRELDDEGVRGVVPAAAVGRGVTYADVIETVADGDVLSVGDVDIQVVSTPGHTTGMTSYLVGDAVLLTGDGLFVESVARPDLEEGDEGAPDAARTLYESLQERVLTLPDETLVAGAHFSDVADPAPDGTYTARLGDLVERMDALSMDEAEFVELVLSDMPPRPDNYEEIIAANLGLETVDDDEAFEMELGPNNCAASQESLAGD